MSTDAFPFYYLYRSQSIAACQIVAIGTHGRSTIFGIILDKNVYYVMPATAQQTAHILQEYTIPTGRRLPLSTFLQLVRQSPGTAYAAI